jgi:hypothetical protein
VTQQDPITPPPELVVQWIKEFSQPNDPRWQEYEQDIATRAAQWGADHELEACCEWLILNGYGTATSRLRTARRPKPPSLKDQSLKHLDVMERDGYYLPEILQDLRRALEALPE